MFTKPAPDRLSNTLLRKIQSKSANKHSTGCDEPSGSSRGWEDSVYTSSVNTSVTHSSLIIFHRFSVKKKPLISSCLFVVNSTIQAVVHRVRVVSSGGHQAVIASLSTKKDGCGLQLFGSNAQKDVETLSPELSTGTPVCQTRAVLPQDKRGSQNSPASVVPVRS